MYLQYRRSVHTRRPSALPEDFVRIFQLYDKSPELQNLFRDATPELKKIFNKYKKFSRRNIVVL